MKAPTQPCCICKGYAVTEQIDSSIGVLVSVECHNQECSMSYNNGWFQDAEQAEAAWNHRQIGEAALNGVLPFNRASAK